MKRLAIAIVGEEVEQLKVSSIAGGNMKWSNHLEKLWQFLIRLKIKFSEDPTGYIYSRKMKAYEQKVTDKNV